jgi:multiple sugar transport system ATP-binding protein
MKAGTVRQVGTPQEIYDEPADTFVASFVGSPPMNLIRHRDYILGFRPENFLPNGIHNTGTNIAPLPFRVTRIEYLGADRLLYGILTDRFAGQKVIASLPSTVPFKIEPEKIYDFSVKESDLNFFSASTELRISARSL